jgi:hypothetical protein
MLDRLPDHVMLDLCTVNLGCYALASLEGVSRHFRKQGTSLAEAGVR